MSKESSKTNGKAVSQVKLPYERTESEANREQGVLKDERQSRESSERIGWGGVWRGLRSRRAFEFTLSIVTNPLSESFPRYRRPRTP